MLSDWNNKRRVQQLEKEIRELKKKLEEKPKDNEVICLDKNEYIEYLEDKIIQLEKSSSGLFYVPRDYSSIYQPITLGMDHGVLLTTDGTVTGTGEE